MNPIMKTVFLILNILVLALAVGCHAPISAVEKPTNVVYDQIQGTAIDVNGGGTPGYY